MQRLPTTDDLDAFCLDYFPVVAKQLGDAMSRTRKENLLLQHATAEEIHACLVDASSSKSLTEGDELRAFLVSEIWDALRRRPSCAKRTAMTVVVQITDVGRAQGLARKVRQDLPRSSQQAGTHRKAR